MNLKQLIRDNIHARMNGYRQPFEIRAEAGSNEATVYIYDVIGWPWMEAQDFVVAFNAIQAETINIRIHSPGGDVFDARAMHTAIRQHPAKTIAHIDGLAASAATYVALAADEVEIVGGGFFMIHKAWTFAIGNADELVETADFLTKIDDTIVADYVRKTGQTEDQVREWMVAESWFTAAEALEHGFVDRIEDGEAEASAFDLAAYSNVPKALAEKVPDDDSIPMIDRGKVEQRMRLMQIGA